MATKSVTMPVTGMSCTNCAHNNVRKVGKLPGIGDVILSSGSLAGIPRVIRISRKTMRAVHQNLFLAFVYNIILISFPLAAGVLAPIDTLPTMLRQLHPILAALAMAMSSISVVTNSLRLYKA